MGTYNNSVKELVQEIETLLDGIVGDFNKETLKEALEFCKSYCPTSDSSDKDLQKWEEKRKKLCGY